MHNHTLDASPAGSVLLDIGADTGALILYVPAARHGQEIEISPIGPEGAARTHAAVRERELEDGPVYCVVYDGLSAGDYTIWLDESTPAGTATVVGGRVAELDWIERSPDQAPAPAGLQS